MELILTPSQKRAAKGISDMINIYGEKKAILKGPAGTGKSVVISSLEEEMNLYNRRVLYVAFTGAATKILMDKGKDASTIHKLIYTPVIKRGVIVGWSLKDPIEVRSVADVIFADEISMIDNTLTRDLESYNIPIVYSGDDEQLPPISGTNPYYKQYDYMLDEVMRQALDSPLLWAATEVRENRNVLFGNYDNKLLVDSKFNIKDDWYRPDVEFIVGLNKTKDSINERINGGYLPKVGSKIVFLKNDFANGIVNGTVVNLLEYKKIKYTTYLTFDLDGRIIEGYKADFKEPLIKNNQFFDLAYARTAHKVQGLTIDAPIVIIDESYAFKELKKNWIYTALTRGTGNYPVAWLR